MDGVTSLSKIHFDYEIGWAHRYSYLTEVMLCQRLFVGWVYESRI